MPLNTSASSHSVLFADDLAYIHKFKKISREIEVEINRHLVNITKWSSLWRLKMDPSKCNYLIISHNLKTRNKEELKLFLYDEAIEQHESNEPKLLGLTFNKSLNFVAHINSI